MLNLKQVEQGSIEKCYVWAQHKTLIHYLIQSQSSRHSFARYTDIFAGHIVTYRNFSYYQYFKTILLLPQGHFEWDVPFISSQIQLEDTAQIVRIKFSFCLILVLLIVWC